MKVLNEREKKFRQVAMQELVTGSKEKKSAARRFLRDIGLSDEAIDRIEGGKQKVEEALKECNCEMCTDEKYSKCNKKTKKKVVKEEENKTGVHSIETAKNMLQSRGIKFDKTEEVGNKTVFKLGDVIVGAWNRSYGNLRTAEDLLKD